jgi:flavin-dependent thymidylate synthase
MSLKYVVESIWVRAKADYEDAIDAGIAKECARMLLPQATKTRMYVNGTVRSWMHYLTLRTGNGTQLEHKQVADAILDIFTEEWPLLGKMIRDQQLLDAITKQISILDKEAKLTLYSTLTNKGA